jgi:hypothetical protein
MSNPKIDELYARFAKLRARADSITGDGRARADAVQPLRGSEWAAALAAYRAELDDLIAFGERGN